MFKENLKSLRPPFSAALAIACVSTHLSWVSPTLPLLTSEESPIGVQLSHEEGSWVASVFLLASVPGCVLSGAILKRVGSKVALLISAVLPFFAWIVIIFAKSLWALILARSMAGLGASIGIVSLPIYIGEIADKDIRGRLGTAVNMLKLLGSLYVLSVGPFVSYLALSISLSVLPVLFVVSFYFMPDTPYYLMKRGKKEDARKNLQILSSNNGAFALEHQLAEIEKTVEYDMRNKSTLGELFCPRYRRALIIMFGIKTLQQLSGTLAIDSYTQTIIQYTRSSISPEYSSMLCGFIQIPAVLVASFLVDKVGRKILFVVSTLGCATALIGEGIYFYLQDVVKADVEYLSWLPTTGLVLYLIMNPIGIFTVPYVLLGELFPTNIKGYAVSILSGYANTLGFIVIKVFNPISQAWGIHTMFWIFAGMCLLGSVFIIIALPETKGKTFIEIQEILHRKKVAPKVK